MGQRGGFGSANATSPALIVSYSHICEKKQHCLRSTLGRKSPWPPPPLHTHCQILINRRLPSFIDESVYIKNRVPLTLGGSHLGSHSWLLRGLGERLSASWRKSTVLDPGIGATTPGANHLLSLGLWTRWSCWLQQQCRDAGKKLVNVTRGKLFNVSWWASTNVKVHRSLTVHNSQRHGRPCEGLLS